jgi:hypothetical protein
VVRIGGNSINQKLISEIFLVRCGSKGWGEVRPYYKQLYSTRSQLYGSWLEKSLRVNNNHRLKFASCPFAQRA